MINELHHIVRRPAKGPPYTLYYRTQSGLHHRYGADYGSRAWATQNIPADMRAGLDYVLLSYYRDKCQNFKPDLASLLISNSTRSFQIPNSEWASGATAWANQTMRISPNCSMRVIAFIRMFPTGLEVCSFGSSERLLSHTIWRADRSMDSRILSKQQ